MSEFKVGDRVCVYCGDVRYVGPILSVDPKGILRVEYIDAVAFSGSAKFTTYAHPKQCRKLKPKRKAREFYINSYANGELWAHITKDSADKCRMKRNDSRDTCIHVKEVLPKREEK